MEWVFQHLIKYVLQPGAAFLVLAGVGTLLHYNDERRVISKGLIYFLVFYSHELFW